MLLWKAIHLRLGSRVKVNGKVTVSPAAWSWGYCSVAMDNENDAFVASSVNYQLTCCGDSIGGITLVMDFLYEEGKMKSILRSIDAI